MSKVKRTITIFEHEKLVLGHKYGDNQIFDETKLKALMNFNGDRNLFFTPINNGIKFNQHVGVIQVGNLTIEILPKTDKNYISDESTQNKWRRVLIGMLKSVGYFKVSAPSSSSLTIKPNHILDLYFELFLKEIQSLIHGGLVKKYRRKEDNCNSLKGNLKFSQHINKNLVHQERFYVSHSTYDVNHLLHQILYKTLLLLKDINTNIALNSLIGSILLDFPEQSNIKVNESTFSNIVYNRKTECYRPAIEIAHLLLMHYHPNLSSGKNHVLALMFDMNKLWEKFVYVILRKNLLYNVNSQSSTHFWKSQLNGKESYLKPDIIIKEKKEQNGKSIVLDTKWKNLNGKNPSEDDLRQMYAYYDYFEASKVALVYPGESFINNGVFAKSDNKKCSIIQIDFDLVNKQEEKDHLSLLKENLTKTIYNWINSFK